MRKHIINRKHGGFSILEVIIGIFIFVVGMLALGALQGALTRSMADSKLRTTAVNIADREIESERGFTILLSDGVVHAYNDIVNADTTEVVNGVTYTIDKDVTDYYYDLQDDLYCKAGDSLSGSRACNTGAAASKYKQLEVTVTWDAAQRFRGDEGTELTAANLGTGVTKLTSVIPALITSASARVADEITGGTAAPPISYTPGQRPDIVSLALTGNKFKESLRPEPKVIRADELVETRFDVITYSQTGGPNSAQFLRREEFSAVSCECTLRAADSDELARRPVVWAGDEYTGGHFVQKPYGESANNQQSSTCDSCCRDHHDGGTSTDDHGTDAYYNVFGPFKAPGEYTGGVRTSDHKHYQEDGVTIASAGDKYLEACRLVRVDGFFRVTQDFRREDQYIFPSDFLDEEAEIDVYSSYVTGAVTAYKTAAGNGYPSRTLASTPALPCIGGPTPCLAQPTMQGASPASIATGELPSWTSLPFGPTNANTQQLRSRGVYIDYISNDLSAVMACLAGGGSAESCKSGDVELDQTGSVNTLEMLPFFDVQLTFLNRWNETPVNTPVDTTNEGLADNNTHSRGVIQKITSNDSSTIDARGHRGNLGFTDTPAIDPAAIYASNVTNATLNVQVGTGGPSDPPPSGDPIVGGSLTENIPGNPTMNIGSGQGGALCGQTGATWVCSVPVGTTTASVTISGYGNANFDRVACSSLTIDAQSSNGTNASTTFDLDAVPEGLTYTINIQQGTTC